jgi:hypothetical protein
MRWLRRGQQQADPEPGGPGVHNADTIDAITDGGDHVRLIMVASGEWFDAGRSLGALQRKLETYATYVATGALHRDHPSAAGKRVEIHLYYPDEPDAELRGALERAGSVLAPLDIALAVDVLPELRPT